MLDYKEYSGEPARSEMPAELTPAQRPASLAAIISRIEQTVDEETASIRTDMDFDLKTSNARKSRYLYDLNKAIKAAGNGKLAAEHREAIMRLRDKLVRNQAAILAHLNAVNEVATLIQGAIQRAEADGTYSAGEFGRR
jgi:hypothetical protein